MSDSQDRIAQLRGKVEKLVAEAKKLAEGRKAADMSAEDISRLEEIDSEVTFLREQLQARERLLRLTAEPQDGEPEPRRRTGPLPDAQNRAARPAALRDPTAGFAHMGDFALACVRASQPQAQLDQRLAQMAPTTYSTEGTGADGGYLIPPEFSLRVMDYINEQSSLYSMVDKTPVNHALNWPVDEEAPWSSSGPQAYWEGEADQYTESKLKIRTAGMRLNKLVALCPVSDELMGDAPQLGAYLQSVISKKLRWKVDDAILNGTGVGMPLGILNAPCLKTVAKEGSQTATTVNSSNVFKMYQALWGDYRPSAVWLYNQDVEVQLYTMVVAGASSDVPVWLPAGSPYANLAAAPNGTLFGRPVYPHQGCQTLGAEGDIYFADMGQYIIGYKTAGPAFAESMHLYFDYGLTAVRATWRLAGMPKWSTTIAANNGSATYSPFVSLAVRA
jgi:HK97 family phage major capsid protein